mmetsp:Transcript_17869/g.47868  ORF Transcript_17869/g.47868 Transcript_17869/m.47868 type:complete len:250 (-) Transcript_17869:108-857(-)
MPRGGRGGPRGGRRGCAGGPPRGRLRRKGCGLQHGGRLRAARLPHLGRGGHSAVHPAGVLRPVQGHGRGHPGPAAGRVVPRLRAVHDALRALSILGRGADQAAAGAHALRHGCERGRGRPQRGRIAACRGHHSAAAAQGPRPAPGGGGGAAAPLGPVSSPAGGAARAGRCRAPLAASSPRAAGAECAEEVRRGGRCTPPPGPAGGTPAAGPCWPRRREGVLAMPGRRTMSTGWARWVHGWIRSAQGERR